MGINNQNKIGAIGFISPLIAHKYPVKIIKFDVESETVLRNEHGRCIEVAPGEAGELVGYIDNKDVTRRFDGYNDSAATEKKIVRDVLREGDAYFRTGDLVRQDEHGFVYFVDRIGETYRWKGENVSSTEVAQVVGGAPGIAEVTVYGVGVPGMEGKAGMASIVADERHSTWRRSTSVSPPDCLHTQRHSLCASSASSRSPALSRTERSTSSTRALIRAL